MRRATWAQQVDLAQTHAQLILAIVQYLEIVGWTVRLTPRGGIPGWRGFPDLFAMRRGRIIFVEAKAGKDRMSADQLIEAEHLRAQGFEVLEARSLDDVMRAAA